MRFHIRDLAACALAAALVVSPLGAVAADGAKIGFVNTDRLLQEAAPAKAAQDRLEKEFSARDKALEAQARTLQEASEQYQRDAVTMSDSQREAAERKLIEQDRDFQQKQLEYQDDLNARKQEELQRVLDQANQVVRQIADSEQFDAIFQEAVYVNPRLDLTDRVIQAMGN